MGTEVFCIADRDNLCGVHAFIEAAKEQGIRPVIGTVLTVLPEQGNDQTSLVYCFVQNKTGFSRLCELLTLRNMDKKNYAPVALLSQQSAGFSVTSME
jgi:DNA polymerase-3 subunit alpha/error-prone DNA polymerase